MSFKIILPTLKVSDDELLDDLKRVSKELGCEALKRSDYEKIGRFSYTSFRNHFGSWKAALEKAGLTRARNWGATPDALLENLRDVWIKLGRQPKYSEMSFPLSMFSNSAYAHKFGNWTNALNAFQQFLDQDAGVELTPQVNFPESGVLPIQRRTKREPNWRLRFKVLQRDNFRCVSCGRSPAKDPEVELHLDHIIAWSKGGETVMENLQTLCSVCNLGKGNIDPYVDTKPSQPPEKLSSVITVEYLEERAKQAKLERFEQLLAKVPDVEPEENDKL